MHKLQKQNFNFIYILKVYDVCLSKSRSPCSFLGYGLAWELCTLVCRENLAYFILVIVVM